MKYRNALAVFCLALPAFGQYASFEVNPFGGYQWYKNRTGSYQVENDFIYGVRFGQDFSQHWGFEESFTMAKSDLRLQVANPAAPPSLAFPSRNYQVAINPMLYLTPRQSRVRPFVTAGPVMSIFEPTRDTILTGQAPNYSQATRLGTKTGPGLLYGGGLKIYATRNLGFRFDVRGMWLQTPHFNLPDYVTGPGAVFIRRAGTELSLQVSGGIIFRWGLPSETIPAPPVAVAPPAPAPEPKPEKPPVTVRLSAIQGAADACPGDTVTLRSMATVSEGGLTPAYQWQVNGQPAGGNSPTLQLPTQGRTGQLTVGLRATAGGASTTASPVTIRMRGNQAPSVQFSVSPSSIERGATLPLAATATASECGEPADIRYTATEGTITGTTFNSASVGFDSNNSRLQTKTVTITATATDRRGQTGSAQAAVTVTLKPVARRLSDIIYPANSSRVNNCGKRLLIEELTPMLRNDPDARVILIGHRDAAEKSTALDQQRVLNAAAVLSAGTGICPQLELSRVSGDWVGTDQSSPLKPEMCGTSTNVKERPGQGLSASDQRAQFRRVEIWVVPGGANMPQGVRAPKALPAAGVKAKGCPN
ncbi:MAG: outer membrane beta-barrel protein [Candidatus Solibacter usitatus]|nr:outer membrane beta-barrel protein [Candidatus Solibacter usitatus]